MTLDTTLSKIQYLGNGLSTVFPVPFKVLEDSHLHLVLSSVDASTSGASSASVVAPGNYSLERNGGGLSVLYPLSGAPMGKGQKLTIYRELPLTQVVDLINAGAFHPQVIEEQGLDRQEMQIQQLSESLDRAVKFPIDYDGVIPTATEYSDSLNKIAAQANADADRACDCAEVSCACAARAEKAIVEVGQIRLDSLAEITGRGYFLLGEMADEHSAALQTIKDLRGDSLHEIFVNTHASLESISQAHRGAVTEIGELGFAVRNELHDGIADIEAVRAESITKIDDLRFAGMTDITERGTSLLNGLTGEHAEAVTDIADLRTASVADIKAIGESKVDFVRLVGDECVAQIEAFGCGTVSGNFNLAPKTAGFTAQAGLGYYLVPAAAAITMTLPPDPIAGYSVIWMGRYDFSVNIAANKPIVSNATEFDNHSLDYILFGATFDGAAWRIYRISSEEGLIFKKPVILTPTQNAVDISPDLTFSASEFSALGGTDIPLRAQWVIYRGAAVLHDSGSIPYSTTFTMPGGLPQAVGDLSVTVRYTGQVLGLTGWAERIYFKTTTKGLKSPTILTPADNAVNVTEPVTFTLSALNAVALPGETGKNTRLTIATDVNFANTVHDSTSAYTTSIVVPTLDIGKTFYARAAHEGSTWGWSLFSAVTKFTTKQITLNTPTVVSPAENATGLALKPTFTISAASVTGGTDTMTGTRLVVYGNATLTTVIYDSGWINYTTSVTPNTEFAMNTKFYAVAQHRGQRLGESAKSAVRTFTTINIVLEAPKITSPADGVVSVALQPTLAVSAGQVTNGTDTFTGTRIQIFANTTLTTIAYDSGWINYTTSHKLTSALPMNSKFYAVAQHRGQKLGESAKSAVVAFTTIKVVLEAPTITSPTEGLTGVVFRPAFTISAAVVNGGTDTLNGTRLWIYTDAALTKPAYDSGWLAYGTTHTPNVDLAKITKFYAVAAHRGTTLGESARSAVRTFTTKNYALLAPGITAPAEGATGLAFRPVFTISAASIDGGTDTMNGTRVMIYSNAALSTVAHDSGWIAHTTGYTVTADLPKNTKFYAVAQHRGAVLGESPKSATRTFTTKNVTMRAPGISAPAEGAVNIALKPVFTLSAAQVDGGTDTFNGTRVIIYNNAALTTVAHDSGWITYTTSYTSTVELAKNTKFYAVAQHRGTTLGESPKSATRTFTTNNVIINAPTIAAPTEGLTTVAPQPVIVLSAPVISGGSETINGLQIQIFSNAALTTSVYDTGWLGYVTSHAVVPKLSNGIQYWMRARWRGATLGESAWSATRTFRIIAWPTTVKWEFGTAGNTTFKPPVDGSYKLVVVGGGGGGGTSGVGIGGGGGGGSGYGAQTTVRLLSGSTYTVRIGAAGNGGTTTTRTNVDGERGGTTDILNPSSAALLSAGGGYGGPKGYNTFTQKGGDGGAGGGGAGGGSIGPDLFQHGGVTGGGSGVYTGKGGNATAGGGGGGAGANGAGGIGAAGSYYNQFGLTSATGGNGGSCSDGGRGGGGGGGGVSTTLGYRASGGGGGGGSTDIKNRGYGGKGGAGAANGADGQDVTDDRYSIWPSNGGAGLPGYALINFINF